MHAPHRNASTPPPEAAHSIGHIVARARNLRPEQIEQVAQYQRERGVRFGAALVALNLATHEDILSALAQQFHYPYSSAQADAYSSELVVAAHPFSDEAEVFRDLRSQLLIEHGFGGKLGNVLAVTSADVGDGKTFFAANLAVAFSQLGGRTLLIDADMRTPRLHRIFGLDDAQGLSGMISGRQGALIHSIDGLPSLDVLPVGVCPPNPLELLQSSAFSLLLAEIRQKLDHIIVDTPAARHGADARIVASKCGATLIIGRRGKTRMDAVQHLLKSVRRARAEVVGVVMNDY